MRQPRSSPARENQEPDPAADGGAAPPRARLPRRKLGTYTIHDVAALAGVSSITVSRYFNAPEKVSSVLREKLRQVIQETGYVPSQMAGRLASGDSRMVGAIMQNTGSTTFASLVRGMTEGFEDSDLQLLLAPTDYSRQREERAIRAFVGWHPSALILTRDDHSPDSDALLAASRCPVVEIWGVVPGRPFHQVGFPHAEIGVRLAKHFLEQGARRIRFVLRDAPEDFRALQRAAGYAEAMQAHGLAPDVATCAARDEFEAGAEAIRRFHGESGADRPQALVFASDPMAAGAMLLAPALGLEFPRDCAIAGFGDAPVSSRLRPGLTTMRPAPRAIGLRAARLVVELLAARPADAPPQIHPVPCELVVRGSSRFGG